LPKTFLNPRKIKPDTVINVHWSSCQVPLFLSDCNQNRNFSTDFRKIIKYKISLKSVQWEPRCSMRTNRRANMSLIVAFRNFVIAPKKLRDPFLHVAKNQHTGRAKEFNELRKICFHFSPHVHIPIFYLRAKICPLVIVICQQNLQNI